MPIPHLRPRSIADIEAQMEELRRQASGAEATLARAIATRLGELEHERQSLLRGDHDTSLAGLRRRQGLDTGRRGSPSRVASTALVAHGRSKAHGSGGSRRRKRNRFWRRRLLLVPLWMWLLLVAVLAVTVTVVQ